MLLCHKCSWLFTKCFFSLVIINFSVYKSVCVHACATFGAFTRSTCAACFAVQLTRVYALVMISLLLRYAEQVPFISLPIRPCKSLRHAG